MNLLWIVLQSETPELPPAVSWIIITALAFSFVWFLNRSVTKMDKSIDRLETAMNNITERLMEHDNRLDRHEEKLKDLQSKKPRRP